MTAVKTAVENVSQDLLNIIHSAFSDGSVASPSHWLKKGSTDPICCRTV